MRSSAFRSVGTAAATVVLATSGATIAAVESSSQPDTSDAVPKHHASRPGPPADLGRLQQAPALPGAQPISANDRIYTADQGSNTFTVINPATNEVLGTIPLGESRLDGVLGPVDTNQVNVHGLGFSRDGRYLDVVSVTSNAVQIVDTATNEVVETTYVGRAPHEAFISPDGRAVWTAIRGQDYVSIFDLDKGVETRRIETSPGPSKVVFSPNGRTAYVNHLRSDELAVINVRSKRVTDRVPLAAGGSADLAVSPDGREVWLGHPGSGKTSVVDARSRTVKAVLESGPRTNHPNFVTTEEAAYAWVTVGGLNAVKVYKRGDGVPRLVDTISTSGLSPHGIWPSPDNSRVYVALQKSDAIDVIDTASRSVVETLSVGQDPQALVYVARSAGSTSDGLSGQGLGERVETYPLTTDVPGAAGQATVRNLVDLDEVDVTARGLTPGAGYDVYAVAGPDNTKLLRATADDTGTIAEALAFVEFFDNGYDSVVLVPAGETPDQ